ncbi:kinase-like protein [Annulohypoxylon nitens]|nr:kinase-like protein [Annulohypoxylon nitens]
MSESIEPSRPISSSTYNSSHPKLTVTYVNSTENEQEGQFIKPNEPEPVKSDIILDLGWELRDNYLRNHTNETDDIHTETRMKIREKLNNISMFSPRKEGETSDKSFIPLNGQDSIISHAKVEWELGEILSGTELDKVVEYVCGKAGSSSGGRGRKIFGILSLINKQHSIKGFYDASISDGHLPVRQSGVGDGLKLIAKGLNDENDLESMRCLDGWSGDDKELFYQRQWRLLSPFFGTGPNSAPFYALEDEIILPWTHCSPADTTGGNSDVSEIRIHDAHHGFYKGKDGKFALKILHSSSKKVFEAEFEALKKVKPHEHLVPVLAAFTHQNRYYMIFPWAEGGNLHDFFSDIREPDKKTHETDHWVIAQCYGLATALRHIHDISIPLDLDFHLIGSVQDPFYPNDEAKVFGRHGDIKPSNVLLFPHENSKFGTLKICDFGLTIFHSEKSKSTDRILAGEKPLTYSAPEITDDVGISRKLDIWCLGCLYLDFITWLLLGPKGVSKFNENRFNEHGSEKNWSDDQFFKRIQIESAGSQPMIKESVINHILSLKSHHKCNKYLERFLEIISVGMLITDYEQRIGSDILESNLKSLLEEYEDEIQHTTERQSSHHTPQVPKDTNLMTNSPIGFEERQNSKLKRRHEDSHINTKSSTRQRRI